MSLAVDSALWVDTLSTVTEFSIGLAGFSSVAAALMQRSGSILEFDRMRITTNICLSLVPGFLAFLAISLVHSGIDGSTIIRSVPVQ